MIGLVVTLMLFIGVALLFGARSRIERLEHRLRLVEEELRRRIAAGQELLRNEAEPAAPVLPLVEPEHDAAAPVADRPSEIATTVAFAAPIPAERIVAEVAEPLPEYAAEPAPAPPPVLSQPPAQPESDPEPGERRAAFNFEELFGRRLPIWAGGITLAIAGVLIVKYAIDAGFFGRVFTPGVQAVAGMIFGFGLIGGAEWAHRQRATVDDPRVSQALSGAGISTLYAALLVAANVYHLISPLAAFAGLAAVTAGALGLSLRHGMPSALLGLAGGLAAPALTVGLDANVPLLSIYLAFTIAGLVGVARVQRWPWLALLALTGGAGWSLWLILAGQALSALGALSIGMFVLLLAVALPLYAFKDAAGALLRAVAAIVGAVQLALLVAAGGYQPLHWGLFGLIAAAGQWLAWRDRSFAIVPTLSAALSGLLLLLWPQPGGAWLASIGLALTAIHALPLLAKLWREPARLQRAAELGAIAAAIPIVVLRHFHAPWGDLDSLGATMAAGGALLALGAAALGWKVPDREADRRFALLLGVGAALLALAAWLGLAHWQAPLWIGAIGAAVLMLATPSRDRRLEPLAAAFAGLALLALFVTIANGRAHELLVAFGWPAAAGDMTALVRWGGLAAILALFGWRGLHPLTRQAAWFASAGLAYGLSAQVLPAWALPLGMAATGSAALFALQRRDAPKAEAQVLVWATAAIVLLAVTGPDPLDQWQRLAGAGPVATGAAGLLRWAAIAAFAVVIAVRARTAALRGIGQALAGLLAYGAAAQVVPTAILPLVPPVAALGLAGWSRRIAWPRLAIAGAALVAVSAVWAIAPLAEWVAAAVYSLGGVPMRIEVPDLAPLAVARRLLVPTGGLMVALWLTKSRVSRPTLVLGGGGLGLAALICGHSLYRAAFAGVVGSDFMTYGLAQRLLWDLLLIGGALILQRRGGRLASQVAPALLGIAALHLTWYSLVLHNPLWAAQSVGFLPLANLLLPLFLALPACLIALIRLRPDWAEQVGQVLQTTAMTMIALFAWASLRHAFHGPLLTAPGLPQSEDILRSLLGIVLAVGYLLWGIRTRRHSWRIASLLLMLAAVAKVFLFDASGLAGLLRIASFVALGFSLIGIGWLYSRQLKRGDSQRS